MPLHETLKIRIGAVPLSDGTISYIVEMPERVGVSRHEAALSMAKMISSAIRSFSPHSAEVIDHGVRVA